MRLDITEISRMSKIERLKTMETIWDSLIRETPEIESPEWHRDILADRKRNIERGIKDANFSKKNGPDPFFTGKLPPTRGLD